VYAVQQTGGCDIKVGRGATKMDGWYCRVHAIDGGIIKEEPQ